MRRLVQFVLILSSLAIANAAVARHAHPYRHHWKHATFGKAALGRVAAGATLGQMTGHPRNFGGGASGFGKRLGAGFATHGVKTTVEHVVAAPLHEDLHYHRSDKHGVAPRLGHALASTVVTTNVKTGKRTPAVGRIAGHGAAGAVSQALLAGASGGVTAGVGLAADAGSTVAREFWPRK